MGVEGLRFIEAVLLSFGTLVAHAWQLGALEFALQSVPFLVVLELPLQLVLMLGILKWAYEERFRTPKTAPYFPRVTSLVICYSEGEMVKTTLRSLTEQIYPGHIELVVVVDGARRNRETLVAVEALVPYIRGTPRRSIVVLPKFQRGGRVSSANLGLETATGDILMAIDGDTSFDNDMVACAIRYFAEPRVVAVAGNLRVRNPSHSLATRLQALEYMLAIHASRIGLDQLNAVNNISGAFGVFRTELVRRIGGWDSGTAEDLDMTLRIKKYFRRHPGMRIRFAPDAIGHTDAPETLRGFFFQRLRWDGDLYYLYVRKHLRSLTPDLLGWPNFIMLVWTGFLFQLLMPFVIIGYTIYTFAVYPAAFVVAVLIFVYLVYVLMTLVFFLQYLLACSERPRDDLVYLLYVPIFPLLMFASRVWCGVSTVMEIALKAHLDSSMAPWWVLRKTKF